MKMLVTVVIRYLHDLYESHLQTERFSVSLSAMAERSELHTRNKHNGQYDFSLLTENYPPLRKFVLLNPLGIQTIDFFNPHAVKALNKALLISYYGIRYWDIPKNYLCPPIPREGRLCSLYCRFN